MKRSFFPFALTLFLLLALLMAGMPIPVSAQQTQIYSTNFNTGYGDWTASGTVAGIASPSIAPNSVSIRGTASITRVVSTVGYSGISLTWNMAASSLESADHCYIEYNTGSGWTAIGTLNDGQDTSTFFNGTTNNIAGADQNASFQVRYRGNGATTGDYCYAEDITITGTAGTPPTSTPIPPTATPAPTSTPLPGGSVPGDPLTGSGAVTRTLLTYANLTTGTSTAPVDDGAFALPSNAAMPLHTFEGLLVLNNEATSGGFSEVKDTYAYTGNADNPRKHLPEFSFEFVQNGSHLIPVNQGLSITGHQYWNYIIGPGRAWSETTDNGWSRASFPFALVQRNANCTHNGVMTFLFNGSAVSNVRYQVTQETCAYYKINMWGQLSATYSPYAVANVDTYKNNHAVEVGNRLPAKPIADLATDYPASGVNTSIFGSGVTAAHMTNYGVVFNGVNYVSGCGTRYGQYAYCNVMRVPSYSTAKSAMASMSLMRLGQKYGSGVYNLLIKDYVPEYTGSVGVWTNVTFNNTIDMATGNYRLAGYEADEGGSYMETFFLAEPYSTKITAAFNFPGKVAPGTYWNYHSSDTFILGRAMQNYLNAQGGGSDIFNMLRDEVFVPLKLSAGTMTSLRTDNNTTGQAFAGYGLFWTQDDIAKVALLLNNQNGIIDGTQILEPAMLADSMQDDATDRGMNTTGTPVFKYNNGFWAKEFTSADGYTCSFYTPFMSGYGGITVVMMPNGATYYYFSDNEEFSWSSSVNEANKLAPHCP
ncbi:MAG TPA: hypothetical protein PK414_14795 [Anaerolineales bacterium]|nr:hypothetical protein [Anaerolineales bacterium]HNB37491.1 hypothetical protein [Anaerolineales bacterium]HNC09026.1 hypothetical protein [Anaerolineales bacterium]